MTLTCRKAPRIRAMNTPVMRTVAGGHDAETA